VAVSTRREVVRQLQERGLSERQALRLVGMSASTLRYEPRADGNEGLREGLKQLAGQHRRHESFNSRFRDECLSQHWFASLSHMRSVIDTWRDDYNHHRPHSTLGYVPPATAQTVASTTMPTLGL
jgi:transposase InsO family protein